MTEVQGDARPQVKRLLDEPVAVVNIGLEGFCEELRAGGVAAIQVAWSPPAGGDPRLAAILARLGA